MPWNEARISSGANGSRFSSASIEAASASI